MPQNLKSTAEGAKSLPCIDMPTILVSSDHSLSFKSINSAPTDDLENDKPTENRSRVKALVEKFSSFQGTLPNNIVNNFSVKKKPKLTIDQFTSTVRENLKTPTNESMSMKGDVIRVADVENIIKNHVFQVFTATTHLEHNNKPLEVDKNAIKTVHFGLNYDVSNSDETEDYMDKSFLQKVVAINKINRMYQQCMTLIQNKQNFPRLKDLREIIAMTLKKGEESEYSESELITHIKIYLEKFGVNLNNELNEVLNKSPVLSHHTRLTVLQVELDNMKTNLKISEDTITKLQKENKDLLKKLDTFGHENIDKLILEKRLKTEQEKNDKLKETIASAFVKKMISYNAKEDNLSNNSYKI